MQIHRSTRRPGASCPSIPRTKNRAGLDSSWNDDLAAVVSSLSNELIEQLSAERRQTAESIFLNFLPPGFAAKGLDRKLWAAQRWNR
jgi:hypothetical protein